MKNEAWNVTKLVQPPNLTCTHILQEVQPRTAAGTDKVPIHFSRSYIAPIKHKYLKEQLWKLQKQSSIYQLEYYVY